VERGATAIVCGSDVMALGVIRAARQLGLRVPEGLSGVGSDDAPFMGFVDPPLTTIRLDVGGMGEAAVAAVLEEIGGGTGELGVGVREVVSVVVGDAAPFRGSVDPPRTTIRMDVDGMGEAAVAAVLEEIGGGTGEHREYLFEPELILRRSTGMRQAAGAEL